MLHAAVRTLPEPVKVTAEQPAIDVPPSLKFTLPVGAAPVTVAVSLADKLDSLSTFFFVRELPTGSKDPFALRRAALSAISLITENCLRLPLLKMADSAVDAFEETSTRRCLV